MSVLVGTKEQYIDFLQRLIAEVSDEQISVTSLSHDKETIELDHTKWVESVFTGHSVLTVNLSHRRETPDEKLSRLIHATKNEELIGAFVAVKELNELVESAEESAIDDCYDPDIEDWN